MLLLLFCLFLQVVVIYPCQGQNFPNRAISFKQNKRFVGQPLSFNHFSDEHCSVNKQNTMMTSAIGKHHLDVSSNNSLDNKHSFVVPNECTQTVTIKNQDIIPVDTMILWWLQPNKLKRCIVPFAWNKFVCSEHMLHSWCSPLFEQSNPTCSSINIFMSSCLLAAWKADNLLSHVPLLPLCIVACIKNIITGIIIGCITLIVSCTQK